MRKRKLYKNYAGRWFVAWPVPGPATFHHRTFDSWQEAVDFAFWTWTG